MTIKVHVKCPDGHQQTITVELPDNPSIFTATQTKEVLVTCQEKGCGKSFYVTVS